MDSPRSHRRRRPRPRLIAGAVVALVAGAIGVIGISNAFAATTGTLVSSLNGKCLDVTGGSTANGNQPQLWSCSAGPNQTWTRADNGSLQALGKCLDVANNSTADGAVVHLWDCYDTVASQKWTLSSAGDLGNTASGKCLDVKDKNTANGAKLQLRDCTGTSNQKWTYSGGGTTTPTTPATPTTPTSGGGIGGAGSARGLAVDRDRPPSCRVPAAARPASQAPIAVVSRSGSRDVTPRLPGL